MKTNVSIWINENAIYDFQTTYPDAKRRLTDFKDHPDGLKFKIVKTKNGYLIVRKTLLKQPFKITSEQEHPNAINFDNNDMLDLRLWINPNNATQKPELEKLFREIFDIIVNQSAQGEASINGKVYVEIYNERRRE